MFLLNKIPTISFLPHKKKHIVAFTTLNYSVHLVINGAAGQRKCSLLSPSLLNMNKSLCFYEQSRTLSGDDVLPEDEY